MNGERYYLFEKNAHGGDSNKLWTFEELKNFFEPPEDFEEERAEWEAIKAIDDLKDYIENHVNYCQGMHEHDYYIEKF